MNKTKIEWCDYTWNPVVGCKHACKYCYARKMNDRFKWIEKWDEPQFFKDRIWEPGYLKKPSKIFVGSMCDLFGEWVPTDWITGILQMVYQEPQHEFMFLTKNPKRYHEFIFPENSWIGTTIEEQHKIHRLNKLEEYNHTNVKKFVSIEPLMGDFWDTFFDRMDLVIVGAMTGPGASEPQKQWIKSIRHKNIFFKDNIKQFI